MPQAGQNYQDSKNNSNQKIWIYYSACATVASTFHAGQISFSASKSSSPPFLQEIQELFQQFPLETKGNPKYSKFPRILKKFQISPKRSPRPRSSSWRLRFVHVSCVWALQPWARQNAPRQRSHSGRPAAEHSSLVSLVSLVRLKFLERSDFVFFAKESYLLKRGNLEYLNVFVFQEDLPNATHSEFSHRKEHMNCSRQAFHRGSRGSSAGTTRGEVPRLGSSLWTLGILMISRFDVWLENDFLWFYFVCLYFLEFVDRTWLMVLFLGLGFKFAEKLGWMNMWLDVKPCFEFAMFLVCLRLVSE